MIGSAMGDPNKGTTERHDAPARYLERASAHGIPPVIVTTVRSSKGSSGVVATPGHSRLLQR
jgi:hypothetical protein